MRVLIVENTAERQGRYVSLTRSFEKEDGDVLELDVSLAQPEEAIKMISQVDVLILGAGLSDRAGEFAKNARAKNAALHVLCFLDPAKYSSGAFRNLYSAGVRKVFSDACPAMDVLQELIAIHMEFCRSGRVKDGQVVCVVQAKGGTGATSICAALGDVCSSMGHRTLLWDLDVDTSDLCRSYAMNSSSSKSMSKWLSAPRNLNASSFKKATYDMSETLSFLGPPEIELADVIDFSCHTDSVALSNRVLECARTSYDLIVIDTAGKIGPVVASILNQADHVLIVADDSIVGLTGLNYYLKLLKPVISNVNVLKFLLNGSNGSTEAIDEVRASLESMHELGSEAWSLPAIPVDPQAISWAGSGKTLYSLGGESTRNAFLKIVEQLAVSNTAATGARDSIAA
jgi:MinD-like ATPase involved in chromosome partitioning or flagellar assembly